MCSGCQVLELCPTGLGTPHTCRAHTQAYTNTLHTHKDIHTETRPCPHPPPSPSLSPHHLRLPQEQGSCGQSVGEAARAFLSPQDIPSSSIKYQDLIWPSSLTPGHPLQEVFLPYAQPIPTNIHH